MLRQKRTPLFAFLARRKGLSLLQAGYLLSPKGSKLEYQGFKLSTGAMWIQAGGVIEQIFNEVGAKFELHIPQPQFAFRIKGKDYEAPEKGRLSALTSIAAGKEESEKVMNAFRRGMSWEEPSNAISLRDWLLQYTQNEDILGIFDSLTTTWNCFRIHEVPAGGFFRFTKLMAPQRYGGFAPEGNLTLMESLARVIRDKKSEIWTRSKAKRVIVTDGVVKGVIVERNKEEIEISAKAVVSNAEPKKQ